MIPVDANRRSQSVIRPLVAATYVVVGLVVNTTVWDRGTDAERTITTYVPCLGKIDGDKIVSVHPCHRSDLMTRMNPVYRASDNVPLNNSGSFVELVNAEAAMPVGVQPDIYWALKILPEIRKKRFATTTTMVTCRSERTKRCYQAAVYKHEVVSGDATVFTSNNDKRKAIQKLADAAGLGVIEGLNPSETIQFSDISAPETALVIDSTAFVPKATA